MSPRIKRKRVLLHPVLVRLSDADIELCQKLKALYRGTRSDVIRAGLGALMREHEYRASHPPTSEETDG